MLIKSYNFAVFQIVTLSLSVYLRPDRKFTAVQASFPGSGLKGRTLFRINNKYNTVAQTLHQKRARTAACRHATYMFSSLVIF